MENATLGELIECRKSKYYTGKSSITGKSLYRIHYEAYFYDPTKKKFGWLASNKPFTTQKVFASQGSMNKFLVLNDYQIREIIDIT